VTAVVAASLYDPWRSRQRTVAARPSPGVIRRRRAVAVLLGVILAASVVWALAGAVGWLGSGTLATPGPRPSFAVPIAADVHIVEPGDTAWSIARSWQPQGEIRPLVDRLVAEVGGGPLQVGDRLVRPLP
jgi:hypothetical protein